MATTYIKAKQGDPAAIAALGANPNAKTDMTGEAGFVAEYYQNAVKDADIISLGMGNGNFGVFALGRLMEAIGFGESDKDAAAAEAMIYDAAHPSRAASVHPHRKQATQRVFVFVDYRHYLCSNLP